ncbi:MAG TPA: GNAT family N-acetyltransferase, partial [Pyrinomonadaceae bacterium]|nr:GNAT family N-acetyltransferase [Pyrinomonadaceae bacterium]
LAWIGMVLVRPDKRRAGIATKLLQTALSYLEGKVAAVKLDATADGKPVYERFGFEVESLIERWSRKGEFVSFDGRPQMIDDDTHDQVLQLDHQAFGFDRSKLVDILFANSCVRPVISRNLEGAVTGYALARSGSDAAYVGPIVSSQRSQALDLLDQLLDQLGPNPVYVDFNRNWGDGGRLLSERGFEKQRDFMRMRRGPASPTSPLVFAIGGPEIG